MKPIGRYEILRELGRGAMGIVYLGKDPKIDRPVAIKCLRPNLIEEQAKAKERFQQEILALGRLIHPNIVTIFDAGEDPETEREFIVMEYIEGVSLAELLKKNEPLSPDQVRSIGIQICHALDFAHSRGVIHRDIKPGNILLSPSLSRAKVTDFGIARIDKGNHAPTDRLLGTPQYMSPEQCNGGRLDGRSDLFAVGALLYELLTRRKPFPGENMTAIIHQVLTQNPIPPAAASSDIPQQLSDVVMKALEKAPHRRFSSGREMAGALFFDTMAKSSASAKEEGTLRLSEIEAERPAKAFARKRGRLIVAATLIAAAVLIGWQSGRQATEAPVKPKISSIAETKQGKIALSTDPSGADILINGERKGISPLTLALPAGSYELAVTKTGHHPLEATINVLPEQEVPVDLKLSEEVSP
ncbi:MAG TPA: serine/threonine-protein kinase [Candidatus Manganitrophaceae bacterium]|nr:serine/threonine-protein kinase [Candidatus Manganitrophaceae bacterium]